MKLVLDSPNFLQSVVAEANENSEAARTLTFDLSEAQLNWKPSPEQWSIAQCLEHLVVATKSFEKYFTLALEHARKSQRVTSTLRYKPSLVGGWLAKQVSPEAARKLPAPKIFRPGNSSDIQKSLESFLDEQGRFLDFVQRSEGIDYNKTRFRSPVTPLMRYSLADAFVITGASREATFGPGPTSARDATVSSKLTTFLWQKITAMARRSPTINTCACRS